MQLLSQGGQPQSPPPVDSRGFLRLPEDIAASRACIKAKKVGIILLVIAALIQPFIDPDPANSLCTLIIVAASLITWEVCLRAKMIRAAPLPTYATLAFNFATLSGALLAQSFTFRAVTFNLQVPLLTFSLCAVHQLFVLFTLVLFARTYTLRSISEFLNRAVLTPMGAMKPPSEFQLWGMGLIGIVIMLWGAGQIAQGGVQTGDVGGKFAVAFSFLTYAPFLIPATATLLGAPSFRMSRRTWIMIVLFFGLVLFAAIARNSRGTFAIAITNLGIATFFSVLIGQFQMTKKIKKILAVGALALALIAPAISDLAIAMVLARSYRGDVSPLELVEKTIEAYSDKEGIEAYNANWDLKLGSTVYSETYVDNPFINRFVTLKFFDNTIALERVRSGEFSGELWRRFGIQIGALLPAQVVNFMGMQIDKNDVFFSMGDFLLYLEKGVPVGGFKGGSVIGHGLGLLSYGYVILIIPIYIFFFTMIQSFGTSRNGSLAFSAVVLFMLVETWFTMAGDSFAVLVASTLRHYPQKLLIYVFIFHLLGFTQRIAGPLLAPLFGKRIRGQNVRERYI